MTLKQRLSQISDELLEAADSMPEEEARTLRNAAHSVEDVTTGLHWRFEVERDRALVFSTDLHHGYFGDSSVTSDRSPDVAREIAKTLTDLKAEIIGRTIARLQTETRVAMLEARDEAQLILSEVEVDQA